MSLDRDYDALGRSGALLDSLLTEDQRAAYRVTGRIPVTGRSGTRYEISYGKTGNVACDRPPMHALCVVPDDPDIAFVPSPDVMVAQLMLLTTDERAFRRLARLPLDGAPAERSVPGCVCRACLLSAMLGVE